MVFAENILRIFRENKLLAKYRLKDVFVFGSSVRTATPNDIDLLVRDYQDYNDLLSLRKELSEKTGKSVDVVVTEYGIAVNPARPEIAEKLKAAGLKIVDIKELAAKANSIIGTPDPLPFGDKVVGVVMNRDGSVLDKIYNIRD